VQLYFPDPWPKTRHHKRRLVQHAFAMLVARVLKPGGRWLLATDWRPYAEQMREVLNAQAEFANLAGDGHFVPRPPGRPLTRFEQRGLKLGHEVFDLAFRRK
jgi:tRNA (guanine-N7-)-methyltransferase